MSDAARIYTDHEVVSGFIDAPLAAREGLNRTLGLSLSPAIFPSLQHAFRHTLRRNPTAGELRFLSAWLDTAKRRPCNEGVGELYTDSAPLAETWADMMTKHAALTRGIGTSSDITTPPCTFEDLLCLTTRYLRRAGIRKGGLLCEGRPIALVFTPNDMAKAAERGYRPIGRLTDIPGESPILCLGPARPIDGPCERRRDTLLLLRNAPISAIADLADPADGGSSLLGNISCLAGRTLPEAVESICAGATLYGNRLTREQPLEIGRAPVAELCTLGEATQETADYLVRVPASRVLALSEAMGELGVITLVVGEVLNHPNLRVTLQTTPGGNEVTVIDLPFSLLHAITPLQLHRVQVDGTLPSLQAPSEAENTAEEIDLEQAAAPINTEKTCTVLRVPYGEATLLFSPAKTTIHTPASTESFLAALQAIETAVSSLVTVDGQTPKGTCLAVHLQADGAVSPDRLTEILCGLYRATASRNLPIESAATDIRLPAPHEAGDSPLFLTVIAMAVLPRGKGESADASDEKAPELDANA